jgi:biotin synthase-related radical SAM superfamily protein
MPTRNPPGEPMTLGNMRMRFVRWFAAICAAAMTAGCASSIDNDILSPYSEPGRYDFLDCATISKSLARISYKEKQLAQLMTRASEAADGAFVNAIAYQDQYNTARAEIRALRKAGEAKKCSPSDLNPTPVAPPE